MAGVARRLLQEFQQVRRCPSKKVHAQRPRWKPPNTSFVKANFDGAIFEDISAVGIGVAVRNELGEVVAAMAEKILVPNSVFTPETLAARHAVLFVQELGIRNVVLRVIRRLPFKLLVIDILLIRLVVILFMTFYCL